MPSAARGSRWRTAVGVAALVVVGVFLGLALVRNWSAVRDDLDSLSALDWAATVCWGALGLIGSWAITATVLTGMGGHLGGHDSRAMYFTGQLGKYVPGSVWPAVIQAQIGARHGIRPRTMVAAYAYALAVSVCVGGVVGLAGLVGLVGSSAASTLWAVIGIAVGSALLLAALLHPNGLLRVVGSLAARTGRDLTIEQPSNGHKWATVALCLVTWIVLGLHAWAIARPLGAGPGDVALVVGGFALSFVAGLLFLPVPGGAGVREAMLVLTIGAVIGRPGALTLALVSRFVLLALDVLLALLAGAVPLLRAARRWSGSGAAGRGGR